jgi:hypothetical protein
MSIELIIGIITMLLLIALLIISIRTKIEMRKRISDLQNQNFEVQIFPWKENTETGHFFKKHELKIGYKYQLFINGIPCFEPHVQIHETLVVNKLDKENIQIAINGLQSAISAAANIHPSVKAVGDCNEIANTLLGLIPKK